MKREQIFCLILAVIVSGAFLAAVGLTFHSDATTIILGGSVSATFHQDAQDDAQSYRNGGQKNGGRSGASNQSNSGANPDSEIPLSDIVSEEFSEPQEPPVESGLTEESDPSDSAPVSDLPDDDFSEAEAVLRSIEKRYSISVTLNTPQHPIDSSKLFTDSGKALRVANFLSVSCGCLANELSGLRGSGYQIEVLLSSAAATSISVSLSGNTILYQVDASSVDWTFSFCYETVSLMESMLMQQANQSALYQEFTKYNPNSFSYGIPDFSLIQTTPANTYFWDVACQKSVSEDRLRVYTCFIKGYVGNQYKTTACPMFCKYQVMKTQFETYILS